MRTFGQVAPSLSTVQSRQQMLYSDAVKELCSSYYIGETLVFAVYSHYYGNFV